MGAKAPFSRATLAKRYPDVAAYEATFFASVDELVEERWVSTEDGEALKESLPAFPDE